MPCLRNLVVVVMMIVMIIMFAWWLRSLTSNHAGRMLRPHDQLTFKRYIIPSRNSKNGIDTTAPATYKIILPSLNEPIMVFGCYDESSDGVPRSYQAFRSVKQIEPILRIVYVGVVDTTVAGQIEVAYCSGHDEGIALPHNVLHNCNFEDHSVVTRIIVVVHEAYETRNKTDEAIFLTLSGLIDDDNRFISSHLLRASIANAKRTGYIPYTIPPSIPSTVNILLCNSTQLFTVYRQCGTVIYWSP